MPKFTCTICQQQIDICRGDEPRFAAHNWECDLCYSVIVKGKYPKNIIGALTAFSYLGEALGDQIVQGPVRRFYLQENPDERVIFLDRKVTAEEIAAMNLDKLFWADVTSYMKKPDNAIWFSLTNEANLLAKKGIYPQNPFGFDNSAKKYVAKNYIILHIRNVQDTTKSLQKNLDTETVKAICEHLKGYEVVVVGNDKAEYKRDDWIDLRNILSLPQIASLLRDCKLYLGRDSGMAHLAAACGAQGVVWNYSIWRWFVNAPREQVTCLLEKESKFDRILEEIDRRLENEFRSNTFYC